MQIHAVDQAFLSSQVIYIALLFDTYLAQGHLQNCSWITGTAREASPGEFFSATADIFAAWRYILLYKIFCCETSFIW